MIPVYLSARSWCGVVHRDRPARRLSVRAELGHRFEDGMGEYQGSAWGQLAYELGQFHRFMKRCRRHRRIELLRAFADKVIANGKVAPCVVRGRYHGLVYARNGETGLCVVCRAVTLMQHHVIQIQHGGLNWKRNRVWICGPCHAEIHPWLKEAEGAQQPAPPDTPF